MLAHLVEHQPGGFPGKEARVAKPSPGAEVVEAKVALDRLETALRSVNPQTAMWSFGSTQAGSFFLRRAHQETMVHRTDAEAAAGIESQLDGDDAADGIEEQFSEFVALAEQSPAGSFHVHRTDGDGEWTLRTGDSGIEISRNHQKGDAALRGSGADLLLLLWGRRPLDDFELFGDREVAEQWLSLTR